MSVFSLRRALSLFGTLAIAGVLAGAILPAAEAQRKKPGRVTYQPLQSTAAVQSLDNIPVVQVSPSQIKVMEMPATGETPTIPASPMSKSDKVRALQGGSPPSGGGSVKALPAPKLTSLTLSAKRPFLNNRGYLEFNEVRHFDPKTDKVSWYQPSPGMGYVTARLNVEKGERYLADMSVSCYEAQTFAFGGQQMGVGAGSHHLLLILEPTQSGWISVTLSNDVSYTFHSFEVTLQD